MQALNTIEFEIFLVPIREVWKTLVEGTKLPIQRKRKRFGIYNAKSIICVCYFLVSNHEDDSS